MTGFPLFDGLDDVEGSGETPRMTVSALTAMVREILETGFPEVWVEGEVSNLSRPRSGHLYFNLKDEGAVVRAVLWRREAQALAFELEDGLAVRALGSLTVYPPRGDYQLSVRAVEPEGIGALELAFRQVVARLAAEGLFDPSRKRPLPRYPRRIAVVTSPSGAAVRDFLQVAQRRWPGLDILIAPTRVQGDGAAEEVARAIALADRVADLDLIVVARGGGSLEDLWAFNQEVVARAIVACRRPVVSAIGHEVDVTVADLAADRRALTPSEAGELCVPDRRDAASTLGQLEARLSRGLATPLRLARDHLDALGRRLDSTLRAQLDRRTDRLARISGALVALNPLAVLSRGYSLTRRDGMTLRRIDDVQIRDQISTILADGRILSRVESVAPDGLR